MARLVFSCVPLSIGSSSESAQLVEGSAESGEQPVLTRLATSGVRAKGGAHPLCCHHPAGLVSGARICIRDGSFATCACAQWMRVRDEADVAARIAAFMAGPCPTVACVVTAATSAAAIRYLASSPLRRVPVIHSAQRQKTGEARKSSL